MKDRLDGPEADKINASLRRLEAKMQADPSPILTQFPMGFKGNRPGPELLASDFQRLVDKVVAANGVKNPMAYVTKAVEKYHQERVPIAT